MSSSPRKDKMLKELELCDPDKSPTNSLIIRNITRSFAEMIAFDEFGYPKASSRASTVYSDARNVSPSVTRERGCFGDSHTPRPEATSKPGKERVRLSGHFVSLKSTRPCMATSKVVHLDIAPDVVPVRGDGKKELQQIHEIHVYENNISVESTAGSAAEDDRKRPPVQETRTKKVFSPMSALYEDECDSGGGETLSAPESKLEISRRSSNSSFSVNCLVESALKPRNSNTLQPNSKWKSSPEISPLMKNGEKTARSAEDFSQTDGQKRKYKEQSKLMLCVLDMFLFFGKCCM